MRSTNSSFSSTKSNHILPPFGALDQNKVRRLIYLSEDIASSSDTPSDSDDASSSSSVGAVSDAGASVSAAFPRSRQSSHERTSYPGSASSSRDRISRGSRSSFRRSGSERPSVISESDESRGRSRKNMIPPNSSAAHTIASANLVDVLPTVYSPEEGVGLHSTQERIVPHLPDIWRGEGSGSKQVGHYFLKQTLGKGGFGRVRFGIHIGTGASVALKSFSRRKMIQHRAEGKIKKEIYFLTLLRHPNIVKLYDVIDRPSELIIVMEYAPNDLFNHIVAEDENDHTRVIPEAEGRRLFQQLICAVEWCHAHQVVHRDLKPENILLDQNYNVKLADFGLSGITKDGEFLRTSCGSPNYASPEVITGKQYTGPEIDVWSCGIILYVLLVSRLPFDDDFIPTLFKKITHGVFRIPPDLSPEIATLIRRMLVCDPVGRITINEIRSTPWFNTNLPENLRARPHYTIPPEFNDLEAIATIGDQYDFAEIDVTVVDYLTTTLKGYKSRDDVLVRLRQAGNNNVKVAYRLHKDRLVDAANRETASQQRKLDALAAEAAALDLKNKPTPEPTPPEEPQRPPQDNLITNARGALRVAASSVRRGATSSEGILVSGLVPSTLPRTSPHRWYFGIKSRSPPMEVMCELYHTLRSLNMEWRECILPSAPRIAGESEDHLPRPRSPFFAEARCRVDDVIIRLDLQLYRQGGEDQDWLVDFRNVGYQPVSSESKGFEEFRDDLMECVDDPVENWYNEDRSAEEREKILTAAIEEEFNPKDRPVVSPFLFMKTACKMISALAGLPD